MSYYSAQAANGANLPHRVTFASFAEGKPIEGKLSDWKKDYDLLMRIGKLPQKTPRAQAKVKKKEEPNVDELIKRITERRAWLDGQPMPDGTKEFFKRRKTVTRFTYFDEINAMEKIGWYSVTKAAQLCNVNESTVRGWITSGIVKQVQWSKYRRNARYAVLEEIKSIAKSRSVFIQKRKGKAA